MLEEFEGIDENHYCSAGLYDGGNKLTVRDVIKSIETTGVCISVCELCRCHHRKFPTPEQFKKEYGFEWKGAVYIICTVSHCTENCNNEWILYYKAEVGIADMCSHATEDADPIIICACTPFGAPDNNWRPNA